MFYIDKKLDKIREKRIGETNFNYFNYEMQIIDYRGAMDIDVYFPEFNCKVTNKEYFRFKKGEIHSPYDPMTLGKGYLGEGIYITKKEGKLTAEYRRWFDMLRRCYDEKHLKKNPTYQGCFVNEDWLNFQIYAQWHNENYYEIPGEIMCLDKDILVKGNKEYGPDTCIFVPHRINTLFTDKKEARGLYPKGVRPNKKGNKYIARCDTLESRIHLGTFDSKEEAFYAYKEFKENYIKQVADDYYSKGLIPYKLYEAMYKYEVEIND